jgi:hypothetical protein
MVSVHATPNQALYNMTCFFLIACPGLPLQKQFLHDIYYSHIRDEVVEEIFLLSGMPVVIDYISFFIIRFGWCIVSVESIFYFFIIIIINFFIILFLFASPSLPGIAFAHLLTPEARRDIVKSLTKIAKDPYLSLLQNIQLIQ